MILPSPEWSIVPCTLAATVESRVWRALAGAPVRSDRTIRMTKVRVPGTHQIVSLGWRGVNVLKEGQWHEWWGGAIMFGD